MKKRWMIGGRECTKDELASLGKAYRIGSIASLILVLITGAGLASKGYSLASFSLMFGGTSLLYFAVYRPALDMLEQSRQ